jgi:hypothetical protein
MFWLGKNYFIVLGWASPLPSIICIIMAISFKTKGYYEKILLFVLILIGFIIVNHFSYSLVTKGSTHNNIVIVYCYFIIAGLIYVPFISLMERPIMKTSRMPKKNKEVFIDYRNLLGCLAIGSVFVSLPFLFTVKNIQLIPFMVFIPFAVSLGILFHIIISLPKNEIAYLLESVKTTKTSQNNYIGGIQKIILLLPFLSIYFESFRKLWFYGFLYAVSIELIIINLMGLYKNIFLYDPLKTLMDEQLLLKNQPQRFHMPSISVNIFGLVISIYLIICFIIIITNK